MAWIALAVDVLTTLKGRNGVETTTTLGGVSMYLEDEYDDDGDDDDDDDDVRL